MRTILRVLENAGYNGSDTRRILDCDVSFAGCTDEGKNELGFGRCAPTEIRIQIVVDTNDYEPIRVKMIGVVKSGFGDYLNSGYLTLPMHNAIINHVVANHNAIVAMAMGEV